MKRFLSTLVYNAQILITMGPRMYKEMNVKKQVCFILCRTGCVIVTDVKLQNQITIFEVQI